jgi:enoyl-CoA hydratase/carnithine racemase
MSTDTAADDAPVLFEERVAGNGTRIGIATLNAPRTLNGFSLPMAHLLLKQLNAWADDDGIAMVVLQGAGEKAFCAGGDLHSLYKAWSPSARPAAATSARTTTPPSSSTSNTASITSSTPTPSRSCAGAMAS